MASSPLPFFLGLLIALALFIMGGMTLNPLFFLAMIFLLVIIFVFAIMEHRRFKQEELKDFEAKHIDILGNKPKKNFIQKLLRR